MTVHSYNQTQGNASFQGNGFFDTLSIIGSENEKNFSFLREDEDLIIHTTPQNTIRLNNHFMNDITRIETINIIGAGSIKFNMQNIITVEIPDQIGGDIVEIFTPHLILGGLGNNALEGGAVNDIIFGGDGDDFLTGFGGNDLLYGGSGHDDLHGGSGNDTITGGAGNDHIIGGSGFDIVDYSDSTSSVFINIQGKAAVGGATGTDRLLQIESAIGSSHDDILFGSNLIDTILYGGAGDDNVQGRAGNDTLYGEGGNDTLLGYNGTDTLYGADGNDTLRGGNGEDTLYGGNDNDFLYGNDQDDIAYGEDGNDFINGGAGNDILYGGSGSDVIRGESGSDILNGGAGLDFLRGGSDASFDIFKFSADEDSVDRIYEFTLFQDHIDITDLLSGYNNILSNINDFVDIRHTGSRFDILIDRDGGGDNFVHTARVLTNINDSFDSQDLLLFGTLIANDSII